MDSGCRDELYIMLVSFYISHDSPVPSPSLVKLINFCCNMNLGLVIDCDANGHHKKNLTEILRSNQVSRCSVIG